MLNLFTADNRLSSLKSRIGKAQAVPVVLILFAGLFSPPAAFATDGVAEINHTCAVQTGCFPGDTAGYPVTIDGQAGGSYRLTSDLIIPDENTDGILLSTNDLGIDLNNFKIVRSGCVGSSSNCTSASGNGTGILGNFSAGTSVKNGSIIGMGNFGIELGERCDVTGVHVRWSRRQGVRTGLNSTVSGSTVFQNGLSGILTGLGSTVSGNTVSRNGDGGIISGTSSVVSGNTVSQNGFDGISSGSGSTVFGNSVFGNGDEGIEGGAGSTVSRNTSYLNGGNGIQVTSGCTVQGNTLRQNSASGLSIGSDSAYKDNVVTSNTLGQVLGLGSGNGRGGNYCAGPGTGSSFCP